MGAVHRLTSALESKLDDRLPNGAPVSAMVAILHALTRADGLSAMRDNAARAYAELPPDSPYRIIVCFLEGSAATYLGDLVGAAARLREGIRIGRAVLPAVYAAVPRRVGSGGARAGHPARRRSLGRRGD